jgi:hypothetical protein
VLPIAVGSGGEKYAKYTYTGENSKGISKGFRNISDTL